MLFPRYPERGLDARKERNLEVWRKIHANAPPDGQHYSITVNSVFVVETSVHCHGEEMVDEVVLSTPSLSTDWWVSKPCFSKNTA
jgi:hypothetical protein